MRRRVILIGGVLALAVMISACGGDDSSEAQDGGTTAVSDSEPGWLFVVDADSAVAADGVLTLLDVDVPRSTPSLRARGTAATGIRPSPCPTLNRMGR